MSVIISSSLTLADLVSGGGVINADNPIIGWRNLVVAGNISATSQTSGFPASNMATPSTYQRWQGSFAVETYIRINPDTVGQVGTPEDLDYVGIARHNFHSAQIAVSLEVLAPNSVPEVWTEIVADFIPASDGPIVMRFAPQSMAAIRVRLQPGLAAPTAAVVFLGSLLTVQRRLYVGHRPMPLNVGARVTNARSESGNFLGRIVLSERTETEVKLQNLTPGWFRSELWPFLQHARELPFFFAWRPGSYPDEVGYGWLTNDPKPENARSNGMMSVTLQMSGIV